MFRWLLQVWHRFWWGQEKVELRPPPSTVLEQDIVEANPLKPYEKPWLRVVKNGTQRN